MATSSFISFRMSWSAPQEPNGIILAYEVTYRVNGNRFTTENTTGLSTAVVLELAPSSTVSGISVRAYTKIGPGEFVTAQDVVVPAMPRE